MRTAKQVNEELEQVQSRMNALRAELDDIESSTRQNLMGKTFIHDGGKTLALYNVLSVAHETVSVGKICLNEEGTYFERTDIFQWAGPVDKFLDMAKEITPAMYKIMKDCWYRASKEVEAVHVARDLEIGEIITREVEHSRRLMKETI